MNVFGLFAQEKAGKNNPEQDHKENYNYEISTDLSSSADADKQQNSLKTQYDIHEDMIFPS